MQAFKVTAMMGALNSVILSDRLLTHWGLMTPTDITDLFVNTGSGNGLLPDGTKPLPEPMLTYCQWYHLASLIPKC